mgnify:CR=1 FL=1
MRLGDVIEATDDEWPAWRRNQKRRKSAQARAPSARERIRVGLDQRKVATAFSLAQAMLREGQPVGRVARELKPVAGSMGAAQAIVEIAAVALRSE